MKEKKIHSYDLTVKKLYDLNRFQQNRRAEMQFQIFQKEIQHLTWTPEISKNSRKIAAMKNNNVPLYQRLDQCLQSKQNNLEKIKERIKYENEMKIYNSNFKFFPK